MPEEFSQIEICLICGGLGIENIFSGTEHNLGLDFPDQITNATTKMLIAPTH